MRTICILFHWAMYVSWNLPVSAEHLYSKDDFQTAAMVALQKGKNKEALDLMTKAVAKDPKNPLLYVNRTTCYLRVKENKKALDDINKAFTLMKGKTYFPPVSSNAYLNRGSVYIALKKDNEAIADLAEAIKIYPANEGAQLELGKLYEKQGNKELALKHLKSASRLYKEQGYANDTIETRIKKLEAKK